MKKLFLFFILFIPVPVFAASVNPNSIEYNISDTQTVATGSISTNYFYGIPFKSGTICQGSTCTWGVASVFGNAGNNSGKYFTFMMRTTKIRSNYTPMVQLIDGSYVNCSQDGNNQFQNVFTATCDLSSFKNNVQVYKYGWIFFSDPTTLEYTSDFYISPLYYYDSIENYTAGIQDISNKMTQVYNNISNVANNINNQTQQEAQQNAIINNTDTSTNASNFNSTISNFTIPNTSHGFDIISGLQNFVSGLSVSGHCSYVSVPIPFTNQNFRLPCMTTEVYAVHFPEITIIWQLLVRGLVYYYICVNILKLIKETIDPFNFKLEVLDL